MQIYKSYMRNDTPQVGWQPYHQIHLHSTANTNSTAQGEASYMYRKDLEEGFYTHVVGNGVIYQTAQTNRGAWDVGGDWNYETIAAIELIESHHTRAEFDADYKLYIKLARELASQYGVPLTLNTSDVSGIKTHHYASITGHGSDHVDPTGYLAKWGISEQQLAHDLANGFAPEQKKDEDDDMLLFKAKGNQDVYLLADGVSYKVDAGSFGALKNAGIKYAEDITPEMAKGLQTLNQGSLLNAIKNK